MSATERVSRGNLAVAAELDQLVSQRIAPGTGVDVEHFWAGFESIIDDLVPRNRELLARRDELQATIDAWHVERRARALDALLSAGSGANICDVYVGGLPLVRQRQLAGNQGAGAAFAATVRRLMED